MDRSKPDGRARHQLWPAGGVVRKVSASGRVHHRQKWTGEVTVSFKTIRARAEKRKGGAKAISKLLPPKPDPKALAKLRDDRVLAEMSRRVFCAGFAWSVIEAKWDG